MSGRVKTSLLVVLIILWTLTPFVFYFVWDKDAVFVITGIVLVYIDIRCFSMLDAVKRVDDTGVSSIVAQSLRVPNPAARLHNIISSHGIKSELFTVCKGLKIDGVSAQSGVLLVQKLDWQQISFVLALCIAEIKELYKGWEDSVRGFQEAKKEAKIYEDAYKQLQKMQVTQLKKLGVQTTVLDNLQAEINALKRSKPEQVVRPPASVNFDYENAVLEQKILKLEDENKALREKLDRLNSAQKAEVDVAEEAKLPDLPEEGVLYVDGDSRRLGVVSMKHPNWVCLEPTYNFNVANTGIKLVIVQRYGLKHKHTAIISKRFPNALLYVVDKANFEDDVKAKLYC